MNQSQNQNEQSYNRFTINMAVNLAAPHTWPASIVPVAIAASLAIATGYRISATLTIALLGICILMQSSVNTLNDYYDYVKGTDSSDDDVDPTDAVLIYNNVNPTCALVYAIALLVSAFILGGYVIYHAGLIPLAIGVIGAVFVVLYSAGKTPISYLPLGEAVSGIVMGGLIPLACYQVHSPCSALGGPGDPRHRLDHVHQQHVRYRERRCSPSSYVIRAAESRKSPQAIPHDHVAMADRDHPYHRFLLHARADHAPLLAAFDLSAPQSFAKQSFGAAKPTSGHVADLLGEYRLRCLVCRCGSGKQFCYRMLERFSGL